MDPFAAPDINQIPDNFRGIYDPQWRYKLTGLERHRRHYTTMADELCPCPDEAADDQAPTLTGRFPAHDAFNVSPTAIPYLTFSENIRVNTGVGDAILYRMDGTIHKRYGASSPDLQVIGGQLRFLNANMQPGTAYYLVIPDGFVSDFFGNTFAGIGTLAWAWTVFAPLEIVSFLPEPGDEVAAWLNLAADLRPTIFFNQGISRGAGAIYLWEKNPDGTNTLLYTYFQLSTLVQVGSNYAVIDDQIMQDNKHYFITMEEGAFVASNGAPSPAIEDENTFWWTTSEDTTPPLISNIFPLSKGTAPGTFPIIIRYSGEHLKGPNLESKYLQVYNQADDGLVLSIQLSTMMYSVTSFTQFLQVISLPSGDYYLTLPEGLAQDVAGNLSLPIPGLEFPNGYSFTIETPAPERSFSDDFDSDFE